MASAWRQSGVLVAAFVVAALVAAPARGAYPETREYLLGDIDGIHYDGPGSVDDVYVDPVFAAWNLPVGAANGIQPFDAVHQNQVVPFTFTFPLASGETVVGATLTIGLRSMGGNPENDRLDLEPDRGSGVDTFFRYDFSDLGWPPVASSGVDVRSIDLATVYGCYDHPNTPDDYLPLLQDGKFNAKVHDDMAIDYANLTIEVMPEPATLSLLALGVGAVWLKRRQR